MAATKTKPDHTKLTTKNVKAEIIRSVSELAKLFLFSLQQIDKKYADLYSNGIPECNSNALFDLSKKLYKVKKDGDVRSVFVCFADALANLERNDIYSAVLDIAYASSELQFVLLAAAFDENLSGDIHDDILIWHKKISKIFNNLKAKKLNNDRWNAKILERNRTIFKLVKSKMDKWGIYSRTQMADKILNDWPKGISKPKLSTVKDVLKDFNYPAKRTGKKEVLPDSNEWNIEFINLYGSLLGVSNKQKMM